MNKSIIFIPNAIVYAVSTNKRKVTLRNLTILHNWSTGMCLLFTIRKKMYSLAVGSGFLISPAYEIHVSLQALYFS